MPAKNSIKRYVQNGYYHIYNRGVEKRLIFQDEQDYGVFLSYLKEYLLPKDIYSLQERLSSSINWCEKDKILNTIHRNNFSENIQLLVYCLMPNHFHMLIKQSEPNSIDSFISSLCTRYVMYFNKKYKRVGSLFQGVYKAVLVESDEQLLCLSAYIHTNPIKLRLKSQISKNYKGSLYNQPSSLSDYINKSKTVWLHTEPILSFFTKKHSRSFHKQLSYKEYIQNLNAPNTTISNLIIED